MGEPTYTIELTKRAIEQLEKIKKSATKSAKERLERIFAELAYTPMNSSGFASPERLRNYPNEEVWSRELTKKDRVVYQVYEIGRASCRERVCLYV